MTATAPGDALYRIYAELSVAGKVTPQPAEEDWDQFTRRVSVPGEIHEITSDAYRFFLEGSLLRLYARNHFCCADTDGHLHLFWIVGNRCYCRHLTRDETKRLCDAGGLHYASGIASD